MLLLSSIIQANFDEYSSMIFIYKLSDLTLTRKLIYFASVILGLLFKTWALNVQATSLQVKKKKECNQWGICIIREYVAFCWNFLLLQWKPLLGSQDTGLLDGAINFSKTPIFHCFFDTRRENSAHASN